MAHVLTAQFTYSRVMLVRSNRVSLANENGNYLPLKLKSKWEYMYSCNDDGDSVRRRSARTHKD